MIQSLIEGLVTDPCSFIVMGFLTIRILIVFYCQSFHTFPKIGFHYELPYFL